MMLALVFSGFALAQERSISGVVSDAAGPLPGVNVVVSGTKNGTQTDFDGKYSIKAKQGETLVFSFLGKKSKAVKVGSSTTVNITLEDETTTLSDVVVVGYQTKKKEQIIGSIKTITKEAIGDQKITTIGEGLQGFTGVQVVNNSGQPGSNPTIRIRGPQSLNANQDPLILLDGAEFKGNLNAISFNDIETYSVLKDADATAIYGNRGARGVILITTKKGSNKGGNSQVNLDMSYGIGDKATEEYDYVNATQMMQLIWKANRNTLMSGGLDQATASTVSSQTLLAQTGNYNPFNHVEPIDENGNVRAGAQLMYDTDWYDLVSQKSHRQDINLSFSGATEKTRYFMSGGYSDIDGFMLQSKFKRVNARVNVDTDAKEWLKVGMNSAFTSSFSNVPTQGGSLFTNNIAFSRSVSNIYPVYTRDNVGGLILDSTGNPIYDYGDGVNGGGTRGFYSPYNPIEITELNLNKYERWNIDVSPFMEIKFLNDFKFKTQYAYSFYLFGLNEYADPFVGSGTAVEGRSRKDRDITESLTWFNTIQYDKTFADKHKVTAIVGHERFKNRYSRLSAERTGFPDSGYDELELGTELSRAYSVSFYNSLWSYFGRADYSYDKRYSVGGSLRRDGSSRFAPEKRWGIFWSAAAAWTITNEKFMQSISKINNLKLRASYGTVGNEDITAPVGRDDSITEFLFPYYGSWGSQNVFGDSGFIPQRSPNQDLTWEVHKKLNFGLDFAILNNRISGTVEYFDNEITDMIYQSFQPGSSIGGLGIWKNFAAMTNKGWELDITTENIRNENFRWTTNISATSYKNEITKLKRVENFTTFKWEVGHDRYEFNMQEWAGVDPQTGAPLWYKDIVDTNGNVTGKVTTSDYATATRYYTGKSALPDVEGRFANNFKYKNFDLNIVAFYKFGNYVYNSDYAGLMHGFHGSNPGSQLSPDIFGAWEKPGDITDIPKISLDNDQSNSTSTRWLQKGDFIRLRTVSLGYTVPSDLVAKASLSAARLYITADNYFTWKKEDKIDDPEQAFNGLTSDNSTVLKSVSFGLNVSF